MIYLRFQPSAHRTKVFAPVASGNSAVAVIAGKPEAPTVETKRPLSVSEAQAITTFVLGASA